LNTDLFNIRKIGAVFGSGNIKSAFTSFETTHRCNKFCRFFELPINYNEWPDPFAATEQNKPSASVHGTSDMDISLMD